MVRRRKYRGQIVDRSNSEGRGVNEAWEYLFRKNFDNWKLKRYSLLLTDKQIEEQMRQWFPGRRTLTNAARMRNLLNNARGSALYHRYLRDQKGRVCMATARGLALSSWRLENSK